MTCAFCGEEVSVRRGWVEVVGWTRQRKQGGTNSVSLRTPTGRLACDGCIQRQKLKMPEEQGRLV